ncbi:MAG: glucose dehydrogenase [Planctomycetaceae bacterium]|nr:glucose dehydrogenase [Planctomycetaceae bacterium]|tara:strand:+ start:2918 stop:3724 length:807 start_codon:yes stop_codon:yes gene_type:complete
MGSRKLSGQRVVVTGASSGIGRAMASQLVQGGNHVLALARREERLLELQSELAEADGSLLYLTGDVTSEEYRQSVSDWIEEHWNGVLDVLVNNAGVGSIRPFAESDEATLRKVMEVNFFAALGLIRLSLQHLRCSRSPVICNVASVLGHTAMPAKSEYCASKFAMHGFSDALRIELALEGIDVVLVSPSTTRSEFFASVISGASKQTKGMSADKVASHALKAIEKGKREVLLSWAGRCLVIADRFMPAMLSRLLLRWYRHRLISESED